MRTFIHFEEQREHVLTAKTYYVKVADVFLSALTLPAGVLFNGDYVDLTNDLVDVALYDDCSSRILRFDRACRQSGYHFLSNWRRFASKSRVAAT